jgi:outer membrane protein assembly factor BamB
LFHRLQDQEIVACLEARTGKPLWKFQYPTKYEDDFGFDEGPRATPTINGDRVFTFGAEGVVHCLNWADGRKLWGVDTQKTFRAPKGFFGMACSPLVVDNAVLINIGGPDQAGIVALDKESGNLLWKATDAEASYSSPVIAMVENRRQAFFLTRAGLAVLDPTDGRIFFEFPWRPAVRASVSAATPLVINNRVFISTSYGRGAALLRLTKEGPETIWTAEDVLSNHYSTSVHHQGFLYGFHGRQEQGCLLRCVELDTGRIRWSVPGLGAGSVLLAGETLLILTEQGELIRAPANPKQFQPVARSQILGFHVRAYPALAQGLFFARDKNQLVCLDLSISPISP